VVQARLRDAGVEDFGKLMARGFGREGMMASMEVFYEGRALHPARWPNEGKWETIGGAGDSKEQFVYKNDRTRKWAKGDDIWMHGYWTWDWADSYEHVAQIDEEKGIVRTEAPHGVYGYRVGQRFYFVNVLEELDSPGEWYLDRRSGVLYVWLPERAG